MSEEKEKWKMPEWMEKYRKYIDKMGGGNPVEELMNDRTSTVSNNAIRALLICQIRACVNLLTTLKEEDELSQS